MVECIGSVQRFFKTIAVYLRLREWLRFDGSVAVFQARVSDTNQFDAMATYLQLKDNLIKNT